MSWIEELPHLAGTVLGLDDPLPEEAIITLEGADIGERIKIVRPWIDQNKIVQKFEAIYQIIELDEPHIIRRNITGWHTYGVFCRIKKINDPLHKQRNIKEEK